MSSEVTPNQALQNKWKCNLKVSIVLIALCLGLNLLALCFLCLGNNQAIIFGPGIGLLWLFISPMLWVGNVAGLMGIILLTVSWISCRELEKIAR